MTKIVSEPAPPELTMALTMFRDGTPTVLTPGADGMYRIDMDVDSEQLFEVQGLSGFAGSLTGELDVLGSVVVQLENVPGTLLRCLSCTPTEAGSVNVILNVRDVAGAELSRDPEFRIADESGTVSDEVSGGTSGGFVPGSGARLAMAGMLGARVIVAMRRREQEWSSPQHRWLGPARAVPAPAQQAADAIQALA